MPVRRWINTSKIVPGSVDGGPWPPDVLIDFESGEGIPVENGGIGGRGAATVQAITPQDGSGGTRLVRAPRYWDPKAEWKRGEPIFVPKQADRLVGWPGPRAGGYWTGPMPDLASTTETVAVYDTITGRTVSEVAGGVVGPTALRVDVAAGQSGDDWPATPMPVLTNDWYASGDGTIGYVHGVVELLGQVGDYRFRVELVADATVVDQIAQRYDAVDNARSGKIYRGVGPHGGSLYEIWAIARLLTPPSTSITAKAYLLSSGNANNPVRSLILHNLQTYIVSHWFWWPIVGLPPFCSYARGQSVAWTAEQLAVTNVLHPYTAGIVHEVPAFAAGLAAIYVPSLSRQYSAIEWWVHYRPSKLMAMNPTEYSDGDPRRFVARVSATRARAATLDGNAVADLGIGVDPGTSVLTVGSPVDRLYGQLRRILLWRRALSDAEMLRAWRAL